MCRKILSVHIGLQTCHINIELEETLNIEYTKNIILSYISVFLPNNGLRMMHHCIPMWALNLICFFAQNFLLYRTQKGVEGFVQVIMKIKILCFWMG